MSGAPEVWFYHLERRTLDDVLPGLVARSRERGWNVVVQARTPEKLSTIDELLWTYADDSFLPHGTEADGAGAAQPVFLTTGEDNPNSSAVRFFIEGADVAGALEKPDTAPTDRAIVMFEERDSDALAAARDAFRVLRGRGLTLSYWQQNEEGRWEKRA